MYGLRLRSSAAVKEVPAIPPPMLAGSYSLPTSVHSPAMHAVPSSGCVQLVSPCCYTSLNLESVMQLDASQAEEHRWHTC